MKSALKSCLAIAALAWSANAWAEAPACVGYLGRINGALFEKYKDMPTTEFVLRSDRYTPGELPEKGRILIPPSQWEANGGIHLIDKVRLIAEGGMGKVFEVNVLHEDGQDPRTGKAVLKWKRMAWKEANPSKVESELHESDGMTLQYVAEKAARDAAGDPEAQLHFLGVKRRFHVEVNGVEKDCYLMDLGGQSLHSEFAPGGGLSLWSRSTEGTGTSRPVLKRNKLQVEAAIQNIARFVRDMSLALAELKHANLVHKDLKPDNIVIFGGVHNTLVEVAEGKARFGLVDFGLAMHQGGSTKAVWGTPAYLAPEARWSGAAAHPAMDVYAIASMLTEGLIDIAPNLEAKAAFEGVYTPAVVRGQLTKLLKYCKNEVQVSAETQSLLEGIADYVGKEIDLKPERRMAALAHQRIPVVKVSDDGAIAGPAPEFDDQIRAAEPTQPSVTRQALQPGAPPPQELVPTRRVDPAAQ